MASRLALAQPLFRIRTSRLWIPICFLLSAAAWAQIKPLPDNPAITAPDPAGDSGLVKSYQNLPLRFEPNQGQTSPEVKFLSRRSGSNLFLTADAAVLALDQAFTGGQPASLRLAWTGANPSAAIEGLDELPGKINYLIGNDPQHWRTNVPTYGRVRYRDVYPGVDLIYYSSAGQLEYDLVLAPRANAGAIRLRVEGADKITLSDKGDLILESGHAQVRLQKPVIYQASAPAAATRQSREYIDGHYILNGSREIEFHIGAHDSTRPLTIDPQLTYSSYLGGSANDGGLKVALDASGNAYVVGSTSSLDYPAVSSSPFGGRGAQNVLISKLNPSLGGAASLVYSTYIGGAGNSAGRGIAVDAAGQVYVAGDTTAPNFPVSTGAYRGACAISGGQCSGDVFAAKLDATGRTLLYSTYLGGNGTDFGFAMALNAAGHFVITGHTNSSNFPTTSGALQPTFGGGSSDAFIAEINPAGSGSGDLVYSTYLGGSGSEQGWGIAVDRTSGIYVTGSTTSANFPVTAGAYSARYSGGGSLGLGDAFVLKLNPAGQNQKDLVYSTYLGGANDDRGEAVAVDSSNRIYVTGFTQSPGFPVTSATAYQSTFGGGSCNGAPCADAFLAKLDPSASGSASLLYSTFFGGSGFDLGHGIALDSAGMVYVAGETSSLNFPLANAIQTQCAAGCTPLPMDDIFVAKFNLSLPGAGSLLLSTYLGGNNVDTAWGIAVDSKGNAYITGQTFSTDFPTVFPYQSSCDNCSSFTGSNPSGDVFLAKLCTTECVTGTLSIENSSTLPVAGLGLSYSQTFTVSGGQPPYKWAAAGSLPAGLTFDPVNAVLSGTPTAKGSFSFTVQVADSTGNTGSKSFSLVVNNPPLTVSTDAIFTGTVGIPYSQVFTAVGGTPPYKWATSSQLPPGITFDANAGALSGTPQGPGSFPLNVQVTDSTGATASKNFTLTLSAPKLTIVTGSPLPNGTAGSPYSQTIAAIGGTPPYTWSLASGSLPGLTLGSNGVLSGTPVDSGSFTFTVGIQDSGGQSGTKSFTLTINPGPLTIITTMQLPDGALGQPFSQTLTATGGTPPYTWSATGLPDGLSLDSTAGIISGAPATAGSFSFTVTVTDNARATFPARMQLRVSVPALPALTITGLPDTSNPTDQPKIQLSLASPYPSAISGQLSLTFTPDAGGGDGTIQFSTGSRIASFTIPAGSTSSTTSLAIQTGTVAGSIKITVQNITAPGQPAPIDITPAPAPSQSTRIKQAAPSITNAKLVRTANGFNIQVTGYSTTREITQAVFHFTAAAGSTLQSGDVTVPVQSLFAQWFQDSASTAFGSQFTFTQPFTVQGDANAIIPGSVTLTNGVGSNTANMVQ